MSRNNYITNAQQDVPDSRDWLYRPHLQSLKPDISVDPDSLHILDQKSEGACTGFAVAATINRLYQVGGSDTRVSARMLYEMARRHDEWPGEEYDGSSLRGAIHGWKNMGVCTEEEWPYLVTRPGDLTIERAKRARNTTIGAYYRIQPRLVDYHAALNESGIIAVSAKVHSGWQAPSNGIIRHGKRPIGGHAFALIGYNIENVMDAWIFQLARPTPQVFGMHPAASLLQPAQRTKFLFKPTVPRAKIAGHFVHVDDGRYKESGRYWSTAGDIEQTARLVGESDKYDHVLFYAHGGLNSPKDSARRINAMRDVFKANRVYPFHVMYDTGLVEELKDLITRKEGDAEERVGAISDLTDRFIEGLIRRPGTLLWNEMKQDALQAFDRDGAGTDALERFVTHLSRRKPMKRLHLVGHSTGAIVIAHLLHVIRRRRIRFESCALMAPACSIDLYNDTYLDVIRGRTRVRLGDFAVYNLKDALERDDNVARVYRKSLLYLVSNAFEETGERPLLGMEKFRKQVRFARGLPKMYFSNGASGPRTRSTCHGGFDNDIHTMNDILRRVLGKNPERPFTKDDLKY
ncbi:MAG: C1 family peptidase [Gammaproteobacteria bacterium]